MGLDGGRSIGMPKLSSESSSKFSWSEFSDSEFTFGGIKSKGGMDMGDGGREMFGDSGLGGGDGDLGGSDGVVGGDGDFCLFFQRRRASLESGGGISITGEPARCTVSVFFC